MTPRKEISEKTESWILDIKWDFVRNESSNNPIENICKMYEISRSTFYRRLKEFNGSFPGGFSEDIISNKGHISKSMSMTAQARFEITGAMAFLNVDEDFPIVKLMVQQAAKGVQVRLVTRPDQLMGEAGRILRASKVQVRLDGKMHCKTLVTDNTAIIGSCNFDRSARWSHNMSTFVTQPHLVKKARDQCKYYFENGLTL